MFRIRKLVVMALLAATIVMCAPISVKGGPLRDWLFRRRCCRQQQTCAQPCNTCTTTCQKTCTRTVVNYVPQTAYRTSWERIPVTQYRPATSTDPCTGCNVTCMRPCTTYTWRMKQTPYTTYRPVYRQETYQVPVTYTTQIPNPCSTCNTCSTPFMSSVAGSGCSTCATPTYAAPSGTIAPTGEYYQGTPGGTPTPAEQRPSLDPGTLGTGTTMYTPVPMQPATQSLPINSGVRPFHDPEPESRWQQNAAPQLINPLEKTTSLPAVKPWKYSAVRFASNQSAEDVQRVHVGTVQSAANNSTRQPVNHGWRSSR